MKKPTYKDFHFDEPPTDEEVEAALTRLVLAEVTAERTRRYRKAMDRWNYVHNDPR